MTHINSVRLRNIFQKYEVMYKTPNARIPIATGFIVPRSSARINADVPITAHNARKNHFNALINASDTGDSTLFFCSVAKKYRSAMGKNMDAFVSLRHFHGTTASRITLEWEKEKDDGFQNDM